MIRTISQRKVDFEYKKPSHSAFASFFSRRKKFSFSYSVRASMAKRKKARVSEEVVEEEEEVQEDGQDHRENLNQSADHEKSLYEVPGILLNFSTFVTEELYLRLFFFSPILYINVSSGYLFPFDDFVILMP
jgi:hypothetical protein